MIKQRPLTLVTPIRDGQHDAMQALLRQMRQEMLRGQRQIFEELNTIHYCRWILLEPRDADGTPQPGIGPRLVFSSNFDGEEAQHLTDLTTKCGPLLDKLYGMCEGYPTGAAITPEARKQYLAQWKVKESAFFCGTMGRTLPQIRQESALRNYVWNLIHTGNWKDKSASQIHQTLKDEVLKNGNFSWAQQPAQLQKKNWLGMAMMGLILLALLPFLIIWILIINFFLEPHDKQLGLTPSQVNNAHVAELETYEDYIPQNQFTQVLVMKPGKMRLLTLQGLMLFAKGLINFLFADGKLMNIPTIHFARWVLIDNKKRMLFFSNFDGSWQQYLGDFIDKSGWGLTGIWSNTKLFPRTKLLFLKGAYDEEHFLAWARYHQVPTSAWYCAYPNLSIKNVNNNTHIRNDLFRNLSEAQAQKFLQRF